MSKTMGVLRQAFRDFNFTCGEIKRDIEGNKAILRGDRGPESVFKESEVNYSLYHAGKVSPFLENPRNPLFRDHSGSVSEDRGKPLYLFIDDDDHVSFDPHVMEGAEYPISMIVSVPIGWTLRSSLHRGVILTHVIGEKGWLTAREIYVRALFGIDGFRIRKWTS